MYLRSLSLAISARCAPIVDPRSAMGIHGQYQGSSPQNCFCTDGWLRSAFLLLRKAYWWLPHYVPELRLKDKQAGRSILRRLLQHLQIRQEIQVDKRSEMYRLSAAYLFTLPLFLPSPAQGQVPAHEAVPHLPGSVTESSGRKHPLPSGMR